MLHIYLFINITIFWYQQNTQNVKMNVLSAERGFIQYNDISGNFYLLHCVLA